MLMEMSLCSFHLVLKQVNVVAVAIHQSIKTNKTRHIEWHETCKYECKFGLTFVIITNLGIMINADVNAKECVINDLFGILVIVSVNVIKRVMLVNI